MTLPLFLDELNRTPAAFVRCSLCGGPLDSYSECPCCDRDNFTCSHRDAEPEAEEDPDAPSGRRCFDCGGILTNAEADWGMGDLCSECN